jgi:hypothetical protein
VLQPFFKWQNFVEKRSKKWKKKIENEVILEGVHGQKWKKKKSSKNYQISIFGCQCVAMDEYGSLIK